MLISVKKEEKKLLLAYSLGGRKFYSWGPAQKKKRRKKLKKRTGSLQGKKGKEKNSVLLAVKKSILRGKEPKKADGPCVVRGGIGAQGLLQTEKKRGLRLSVGWLARSVKKTVEDNTEEKREGETRTKKARSGGKFEHPKEEKGRPSRAEGRGKE